MRVGHAPLVGSMGLVRRRIFGQGLGDQELDAIVADIVAGRYSTIDTTAFVTACAARPLRPEEVKSLTRAMVENGDRLHWDKPIIADKHSVGGLPGQPHHTHHRGHLCRAWRDNSQDFVPGDHFAGGHRGHNGSLGAGDAG